MTIPLMAEVLIFQCAKAIFVLRSLSNKFLKKLSRAFFWIS